LGTQKDRGRDLTEASDPVGNAGADYRRFRTFSRPRRISRRKIPSIVAVADAFKRGRFRLMITQTYFPEMWEQSKAYVAAVLLAASA
jgi:hypothetical protein